MDGQTVATALSNGTIDLRPIRTNDPRTIGTEPQRTLESHSHFVCSVAFSADGTMLATSSWDHNTVQLWNLKADTVQLLEGHTARINSVAFSKKGILASAADFADGSIRLWNDKSGAYQRPLKGDASCVDSINFSHDGTALASVTEHDIQLWKLETDAAPQTLKGQKRKVLSVAFSQDGTMLASASHDYTVLLWNLKTGSHRQILKLDGGGIQIMPVAFLDNDLKLALASPSGFMLGLQVVETNVVQQTSTCHDSVVRSITFSNNGTTIASASEDSTVRLWDVETGSHQRTLELRAPDGYEQPVCLAVFSADGTKLAAASYNRKIWIWNLKKDEPPQLFTDHRNAVSMLVFSANNERLASGDNCDIRLWDLKEGKLTRACQGHRQYVKSAVFSTDSRIFASASPDNVVRIWSTDSGDFMHEIQAATDVGQLLSFSGNKSSLSTDRGTLSLDTTAEGIANPFTPNSSSQAAPTLMVNGDWIARGPKALLRLPPDFGFLPRPFTRM